MTIWIENAQLGNALLKASGLLIATVLLLCLMRRASATSQFRVCFGGLCLSLLVALVTVVAPLVDLDYALLSHQGVPSARPLASASTPLVTSDLHSESSHARSRSLAKTTLDSKLPTNHSQGNLQTPSTVVALPSDSYLDSNPASVSAPSVELATIAESERESLLGWSWIQRCFRYWPLLWLLGAVFVYLRLLTPFWISYRASQRLETLDDATVTSLSRKLAHRLHLSVPSIGLSLESTTPYVVGLWQPKIILPPDARTWSNQRLTFVLTHEMAHIKRRDLLTQWLVGLPVAVNWFNPLSWWLLGQMLRLRELACDDCVLLQQHQPASYAETLLEVAANYRAEGQVHGIAMAGKLDIASRIHCVLDSTRVRTTFGKRTLFLAVGVASVLCMGIGSVTMRARAAGPQDQTLATASEQSENLENKKTAALAGSASKSPVNEQARSMLIRVLDEQSQPLEGVDVYVTGIDYERRGGSGKLPRVHYPTDATGTAVIKFRDGTLRLQLWPRLEGYVPQYVPFNEKELSLPSEYTFYFERGERLAGRIIDTLGKPIEGATVQVKTEGEVVLNERAQQSSPPAGCSGWLAEGELAATTNADGQWEILNAPSIARNPKLQFRLLVDHPEFVGDAHWGSYQNQQGITSEQLRDATASLVMERGVVLGGTISGPDGAAVTQGLVIWVRDPYLATGVNEVPIQSDGTFQLPNLAPGKYPITVLAPGFAPDQREVDLSLGTPPCNLQLESGNPIRIEIVDTDGNPIPTASVSFQQGSWRGTNAIYNNEHPNVPKSGIPRKADENGVYSWDWAPADAVTYSIYQPGYDSKSVTLVAKPEPHRVVLMAPMKISGSVVDAETGNPISEFKVMPVKAYRPNFYSTDFQEYSVANGKNGKYEIRIDSRGESTDRHRVRIEAAGYRSALGRLALAPGEPALVEDFQLEPAVPLIGRVASPDGSPANQFDVVIGTATTSPQFSFEHPDNRHGQAFKIQGKSTFEIAASFEPQRLRVFNNEGFAELVVQPEQKEIGEVLLQPYANVSGRLMQGDVPMGNEGIYFFPLAERGPTEARFQDSFFALTDPEGYFDFGRLPPMPGCVRALLGPWRDSRMTSSQSIPLDLRPGDDKQVVLSGEGIPVYGRVVAKGRSDAEFSKQWSLNWLVSRKAGVSLPADATPLSIPSTAGPLESEWLKHSDFSAWISSKQNHYVKLRGDGEFTIQAVSPGEYDLVIKLYDQPAGCLVEAVGTRVVPVTITAAQIDAGKLELETIEIECRSGPRPGADMRAYKFVNAEGQVVTVNDLGGRHVLLHVWASWCAPCLATMPELKADISQQFQSSLVPVGINIDADRQRGQTMASTLELDWAQNFVGDDSDLARQLAISSVPAYYLIGPDGKLIASASEWKTISTLLKDELER